MSIIDRSGTVCVVGAGPAGLVVARQLRQAGIPFQVFERHHDVGGIWDPDNTGSPMYRSAHFISSKYSSGFVGFPMPEDFPDYPSWRQVLGYIRDFARAEDLYQHITFNTEVTHAEPLDDNRWRVTVGNRQYDYRAVVVAPGVTWHPNRPLLAGEERFAGDIIHSSEYFESSSFHGKRVLIVGAGNSGVDIACDAAANADAAFLSVRRGYRFLPKHVFGVPLDVFINHGGQPPAGITIPEDPNELVDALVGDLTRFGLPAPDHDVLSSHPIVNDRSIHHFNHGDIAARPDIQELDGHNVVFADGRREPIDLIVLATGYEYRVPFINEDLFEWSSGHPQLYLNIFHRRLPNLSVVGFIEFADAAYERFEEMAQLVAMDLSLQGSDLDTFTDMKRSHRPDLRGGAEYIDTPRHANYVETHTYQEVLATIREQFGVAPLSPTTAHAV